jgi:hypothetical protein
MGVETRTSPEAQPCPPAEDLSLLMQIVVGVEHLQPGVIGAIGAGIPESVKPSQ